MQRNTRTNIRIIKYNKLTHHHQLSSNYWWFFFLGNLQIIDFHRNHPYIFSKSFVHNIRIFQKQKKLLFSFKYTTHTILIPNDLVNVFFFFFFGLCFHSFIHFFVDIFSFGWCPPKLFVFFFFFLFFFLSINVNRKRVLIWFDVVVVTVVLVADNTHIKTIFTAR